MHTTIPLSPITTKLNLTPQDLTTKTAMPWFYGFFMGLAVVVVVLFVLMCLAIGFFKRRAQNGGTCYLCT